mmetsp:Transcript_10321/g.18619  ORF Transcript_10321/g.18619 Transcript_10321/m.18619 type:complete len:905 (+) Transcript_10321:164-2878(+)
MSRNFRPPPPRGPPRQQPTYDTIDSLFDRQNNNNTDDSMKNSSMNDIDSDDEKTEMSDNDSVLAMAKRLDAASVISDPSFIEGTSPHMRGVDPGGLGGGRDNGNNGRRGPGGLYARDRDLDSIASESESSSSGSDSSGSSSDSSAERNPRRGQRPMGQPRVGFHGSNNNKFRSNHRQGPPGSYVGGGGERPPPPGNNNYFSQDRGRQHNPGPYIPDQGPPEYNTQKNVRFSERGQRRVFRDHEEGGGPPGSAPPPPRAHRSRSPSQSSRGSKRSANDIENDKREKRRRLKLMMIPIAVLIGIGIAVAIAVVVGKQGGKDDDESSSNYFDVFSTSLPTASPTYEGLYNCPFGTSGAFAIKGCLGYVQCNAFGEEIGEVIMCPSGTLYDAKLNVCNHIDQVQCSTRLPPIGDLPTPNPTPWPTPKPTIASYTTRPTDYAPAPTPDTPTSESPTEYEQIYELQGPTPTYGHKLAFIGVSSPGDMSDFQQNLEDYLNIFYLPSNLARLDEDDELRSLSYVSIDVTVTSVENRRLARSDDDAKMPIPPNNIRGKQLQQHRLQSFQLLQPSESEPKFIAIYDQITTYSTSDPFISVDTIVRRPFDPEYSSTLVELFQRRDPNTFSTLTDIQFVEDGDPSMPPQTITTAAPTSAATTKIPTNTPTKRPNLPVETNEPTNRPVETNEPTPFTEETSSPTKRPLPSPTGLVIEFPILITIQGLLWLDENEDGLFEPSETPMEGLFVNLRECEGDIWKATTKTSAIGQYQFVGIEEGEYYVDFFKPNPIDRYKFTRPRVGGDDDMSLDSDVVKLKGNNGISDCIEVKDGFKKLINAGYNLLDTPAPTPSPTPAPPKPSTSPTTAAPTHPRFCAEVTESGGGTEFDFRGCSLPCKSPQHKDCPDGMLCALTTDCS